MPKKLDDMHSAIKLQLKKDHPDWDDEKVDSTAWAIANDRWKKMKEENYKMTDDGEIIVGENVNIILGANISNVGNIIEE